MSGILEASPLIIDTIGWKSLCTGKKGGFVSVLGGEALSGDPCSCSSHGGSAVPADRCAVYRELHHEALEASLSSRDATCEHSRATSISKPAREREELFHRRQRDVM